MVKLADAEWRIMELLWEKGSLTTMEISRELEDTVGWSKSTVITLLNRMASKESVIYKTENKTKVYYPNVSKDDVEVEEAKSFLNKFFNGNVGLMVSALLEHEELSDKEIDELNRILKGDK